MTGGVLFFLPHFPYIMLLRMEEQEIAEEARKPIITADGIG